jgi:hypothetical protein
MNQLKTLIRGTYKEQVSEDWDAEEWNTEEWNTENSKKLILGYKKTGSVLKCMFYDKYVFIKYANSIRKKKGGFSVLLSRLEEIAETMDTPRLFLQVWKTNKAVKTYENRGFRKIERKLVSEKQKNILFMLKEIEQSYCP